MPFTVKKLTPIKTDSLENLGSSVLDLAKYTEDEFGYVASAFQATEPDTIWNKIPPRPRRGTTAYADGTNWNPGSGEGPYFWNGVTWVPEFTSGVSSLASVQSVKERVFTASGTYVPSGGMLYCIIECVGGGGGGGGVAGNTAFAFGGGGGGSGGYSRRVASAATIGVSQTVTIGAAGAGGLSGANPGSAGGVTSLGSLCIANGGNGGGGPSSGAATIGGGTGGAAGTGDVASPGGGGVAGLYLTATGLSAAGMGGAGGSSLFGSGGIGAIGAGGSGTGGIGAAYGSGGGGAGTNTGANAAGGPGAAGVVIITEFCGVPPVVVSGPPGSHASAFLARTSGLDSLHTNAYISFINGLDTDGLFSKFDVLYIFATKDSTTALLNLVSTSYNGVASGSPVFTVDRGFAGGVSGGGSVAINTGFNPTAAPSPNYTLNSAHQSVWGLNDIQETRNCIGATGAGIFPRYTDNNGYFNLNTGTNTNAPVADALGHSLANRSASNAAQGYKNGSSLITSAAASTGLPNLQFFVLADNNGAILGANNQLAMASIGSSLSATDVANFYNRLRIYMTTVGVP